MAEPHDESDHPQTTVLVVGRDADSRRILIDFLSLHKTIDVVGEAEGDASEVLSCMADYLPDLILIDTPVIDTPTLQLVRALPVDVGAPRLILLVTRPDGSKGAGDANHGLTRSNDGVRQRSGISERPLMVIDRTAGAGDLLAAITGAA